jgi:hypothetical protein
MNKPKKKSPEALFIKQLAAEMRQERENWWNDVYAEMSRACGPLKKYLPPETRYALLVWNKSGHLATQTNLEDWERRLLPKLRELSRLTRVPRRSQKGHRPVVATSIGKKCPVPK